MSYVSKVASARCRKQFPKDKVRREHTSSAGPITGVSAPELLPVKKPELASESPRVREGVLPLKLVWN